MLLDLPRSSGGAGGRLRSISLLLASGPSLLFLGRTGSSRAAARGRHRLGVTAGSFRRAARSPVTGRLSFALGCCWVRVFLYCYRNLVQHSGAMKVLWAVRAPPPLIVRAWLAVHYLLATWLKLPDHRGLAGSARSPRQRELLRDHGSSYLRTHAPVAVSSIRATSARSVRLALLDHCLTGSLWNSIGRKHAILVQGPALDA